MDFTKMRLSQEEAILKMDEWINTYPQLPELQTNEENALRNNIQQFFFNADQEVSDLNETNRREYYRDTIFSISLYNYLMNIDGFSMRIASDNQFWKYLSLIIAPDVISKRWGKDNVAYYYKRPDRIWFKSSFWYIHFTWQGNADNTKSVILSRCFTTDTRIAFISRTGKKGAFVSLYREIAKKFSEIPANYSSTTGTSTEDLFRGVMKLSNAKTAIIEPDLYPGGNQKFAEDLFVESGVNFTNSIEVK